MLLEPLVSIILLLFFIFLLAALIIWLLIELRAMGLRDKERNKRLQAVAASSYEASVDTGEFDAVAQQDLDVALNTGLALDAKNTSKKQIPKKQTSKTDATPSKHRRAGSKKSTKSIKTTRSVKSSGFKTPTLGAAGDIDPFAQFAEAGAGSIIDLEEEERNLQIEHEAALLKPPKPEEDIFSTSERRDDIWLFHTAEVDPVHPAEDMTKFRQPGGITGESARSTHSSSSSSEAITSNTANQIDVETSVKPVQPNPKMTTEITPPIQPENKLRDTFGRDSRNIKDTFVDDKVTDDKVVRMTNSSSRVAAERLIVDKELRLSQVEVHQLGSKQDDSVVLPAKQSITPSQPQPSQPFQGEVPPIPKGVQQNLKQTLDEVTDNVSNVTKDDWKNYKNLKNTRSLISTNADED